MRTNSLSTQKMGEESLYIKYCRSDMGTLGRQYRPKIKGKNSPDLLSLNTWRLKVTRSKVTKSPQINRLVYCILKSRTKVFEEEVWG